MPAITSKLMGYNKKQVDKHLETVLSFQENEISLIMENINAYEKEREQLTRELNALQNEMANRVKPRDFLEYSLERAKNYAGLAGAAVKEDIQGISRSLKQKIAMYDNYLGEVENEITKVVSQMDSMLQGILSLIKEKGTVRGGEEAGKKVVGTILSSSSKFESIITALGSTYISANEDITGRTVVSSNGAYIGQVESLVINESTSDIEGFYLKEEHPGAGRFVPADCVMAVKKDSLVVSADWQKVSVKADNTDLSEKTAGENLNIVEDRMTADGIITPRAVTSVEPADSSKDENTIQDMPAGSPGVEREVSGSFWENPDLDLKEDYLQDSVFLREEQDNETGYGNFGLHEEIHEVIIEEEEIKEEAPSEFFFSPSETASAVEAPAVSEAGKAPVIQERAGSPGFKKLSVEPLDTDKKVQASPAVEKEIKTIRHKYVVGKLAGEDLLDSGGKVIILKNELITPEVVEKAEMEGKLPELIINMVIPGLEN